MNLSKPETLKERVSWWAIENGKKLSLGLLVVSATLFSVSYIAGKLKKSPMETFLYADNLFQRIYVAPDKEKIYEFEKILSKHQVLHPKYDSLILSTLMNVGDSTHADVYVHKILARMGKEIPFHTRFLKIASMIHQKHYALALDESLAFKKDMEMASVFFSEQPSICKYGHFLYAYNLIRIGVLYKTLGRPQEELKTWKEYLIYSQNLKTSSHPMLYDDESIQQMKSAIGSLGVTIEDYIKQRASYLSKSLN